MRKINEAAREALRESERHILSTIEHAKRTKLFCGLSEIPDELPTEPQHELPEAEP